MEESSNEGWARFGKLMAVVVGLVVIIICLCGALLVLASRVDEGELATVMETQTIQDSSSEQERTTGIVDTPEPTKTATPEPTETATAEPTPTTTPSALTMRQIENNYDTMTSLQWGEYEESLTGTKIRWVARVSDVSEDGTIYLDAGEESWLAAVYLDGVSREVLETLSQDQIIEVEATISRVSTFLGLSVWLDNPVVFEIR